jgi:hypothetical protein
VSAAATGGYLLGKSSVAGEQDALAARHEAQRTAFVQARDHAIAGGRRSGLVAGRAASRQVARRLGAGRGLQSGTLAAARSVRTPNAPSLSAALQPATRAPILSGTGRVLVVGDSLEVLTSPYLKRYLPGVPLTVNAVGGYSSLQIFDLFKQSYSPSDSVIVFDAGTNDNPSYPQILAGRLNAVANIVGNRCLVVPTIHGLLVNGVTSAGKNRVVRQFAASRPGTQTPDWAGFVASHPELMQPDHLHPNTVGADARAQLIAEGVRQCLALSPLSGAGVGR